MKGQKKQLKMGYFRDLQKNCIGKIKYALKLVKSSR